jgi:hypothetical protein
LEYERWGILPQRLIPDQALEELDTARGYEGFGGEWAKIVAAVTIA